MPVIGKRLDAQATGIPLPTGEVIRKSNISGPGQVAWPSSGNYLNIGTGSNGELGPFNQAERFFLRVGGSFIYEPVPATGWIRFDWALRLLGPVSYVYGNDLNGINLHLKTNSVEDHPNPWMGGTIEATYYCEKNSDYWVRLLTNNSASGNYWQQAIYTNMWAYTVGEGDRDY